MNVKDISRKLLEYHNQEKMISELKRIKKKYNKDNKFFNYNNSNNLKNGSN